MVAGCESTSSSKTPQPPPQPVPPPPIQEAPAPYRAQLHAEIASGFYERGQMDVALQELAIAIKLDPTNARIYNVYGLVYAVLGEDANAQRNFQTALELAPTDSEIRQNWGWFLCTHGKARESSGGVRPGGAQSALQDARRRAHQRRQVLGGDRRRQACRGVFQACARINVNSITAAYNLSLLAYREKRLDEARALIRRVMQQPSPPPDALYLGMCIERKLGDRPSEASYVSQLRNRYPDSAEARAIPPGTCE